MTAKNQSQSVSIPSAPIVTLVDDIPTTLSTDVAAYFGKRHNNVLGAIEKIIETLPQDRLLNFQQTEVERESPLQPGTKIKSKAYRLTRDGFTFLAMGFTGTKRSFSWISGRPDGTGHSRVPSRAADAVPEQRSLLRPFAGRCRQN